MNQSMTVEQIEKEDWNIEPSDDDTVRRSKSISAYYLTRWYELVKDITFKTFIYPMQDNDIASSLPNPLPFERSMVRYENRSPKDSEHWGPCGTPEEAQNIFKTSLRCHRGAGKYICVREWCDDIFREYRCFWNQRLCAVGYGADQEFVFDESNCQDIIHYVDSIKDLIPYHRCVFDIAVMKSGRYVLVEFNSWETNSGAQPFDWKRDTEIMYPDTSIASNKIHFKSLNNTMVLPGGPAVNRKLRTKDQNNEDKLFISRYDSRQITDLVGSVDNMVGSAINCRSNCVITDQYIIVSTDIWLVCLNHNFRPLCWKRGEYRFSDIKVTESGLIKISSVNDESMGQVQTDAKREKTEYLYPSTLSRYEDKYQVNKDVNLSCVKERQLSTDDVKNNKCARVMEEHRIDNRYGFYFMHGNTLMFIHLVVDTDDYYFCSISRDAYIV